jgi:hypothetical protein
MVAIKIGGALAALTFCCSLATATSTASRFQSCLWGRRRGPRLRIGALERMPRRLSRRMVLRNTSSNGCVAKEHEVLTEVIRRPGLSAA